MKLAQRKEPIVEFREEDSISHRDWLIATLAYKIKRYVILYDNEERIYINPAMENSQKFCEIVNKIFKQRYLNNRTCKLFNEISELTDKETESYLLTVWNEWRKKVKHMELNAQAMDIVKRMRSKRLYYKARKNSEMIMELFNIGVGFYDDTTSRDFQKGAENTFMYGYLLGIEETVKKGMPC